MAVVQDLTEEEKYLVAVLLDQSGVDQAEFCWVDETSSDNVFRCWDYQVAWFRADGKLQVDQAARSVGKTTGIQMRAFAFPFCNAGEEMLLTAPELIHLEPLTKAIEDRILSTRITERMLETSRGRRGIVRRPFEARFKNGARIIGRIPQKDGRGVKGMHPRKLELDEANDFPEAGWVELTETLKYGDEGATWRAHGVTRGVRDYFWKITQPDSGWEVHQVTAMQRPDWSNAEREQKAQMYGGRHTPDYRRNILGAHGDAQNPLFVLARLMECVDSNENSDYNRYEYQHVRITYERMQDTGMPIEAFLEMPPQHQTYDRVWIGADIGVTNHPTEILVFAEIPDTKTGGKVSSDELGFTFRLVTRVHLERISVPEQRKVFEQLYNVYRPQSFAMDKTGLGLPLYQEVVEGPHAGLANAIRGYNFSEKIAIGWEKSTVVEDEWGYLEEPEQMKANVLEFSSDQLRLMVDRGALRLPWDIELIREFQGQTYSVRRSSTSPYGRKEFSSGQFHCLDAARMAVLAWKQRWIEETLATQEQRFEPVLDSFVMF